MDKKEILEKAQSKKAVVGEMEHAKINKSSWIALIVTYVFAVALMIVEGALGHKATVFGIGAVCFVWPAVLYYGQYFIAKRTKGVLIGAVLETLGALIMILNYILCITGVI